MRTVSRYWIRTAVGLEKILLQELSVKFKYKEIAIKHKSVFIEMAHFDELSFSLYSELKTADDIYTFLGSCTAIDHTKASTLNIVAYFEEFVLPILQGYPQNQVVRITVSFLGTRNFNRFFIENILNSMMESRTTCIVLCNEKEEKWVPDEKRIRIHIEDQDAYFGIGLRDKPLHRRPWRINTYPAQLHPPLAAAMAFILQPSKGSKIVDPFCGSGTILIESALQNKFSHHIGFDTNPLAIDMAEQNAIKADLQIDFFKEDFFDKYKNFEDYFIISNPPWGDKHSISSDKDFYSKLFTIIHRSSGAVLLIPDEIMERYKMENFNFSVVFQTRVKGKRASVISITK